MAIFEISPVKVIREKSQDKRWSRPSTPFRQRSPSPQPNISVTMPVNDAQHSELEKTKMQLAAALKRTEQLEEENRRLAGEKVELGRQVEDLENTKLRLAEAIGQLRQEKRRLKGERDAGEQRLLEAITIVEAQKQLYDEDRADLERLQRTLVGAMTSLASLAEEKTYLSESNEDFKQEVLTLRTEAVERRKEITELNDTKFRLADALAQIRNERRGLKEENQLLRARLEGLSLERSDLETVRC